METFNLPTKKKVNGRDVSSKEDAETLFSENKNAVTLLVSRSFYTVSYILSANLPRFSSEKKLYEYEMYVVCLFFVYKSFKVVVDYHFFASFSSVSVTKLRCITACIVQ